MDQLSVDKAISDALRMQIEQDNIDVPMLPKVANRVIQLTQNADSDAEELSRLIQSDQPLAAHVMRIANSALYSPSTTLVSLQQAITRLGMQIIAEIALAASINSKVFNAPGFGAIISQQLKHSLHCGLWAKEVARQCRRNVEAAFLAGLLHDIGRPVGIQAILEIASKFNGDLEQESVLNIAKEFEQSIGVKVVKQWEMPTIVCDVVAWLHDYRKAGQAQELTMFVVAGTRIARFCETQGSEAEKNILAEDSVFADLNLYPDDTQKLLDKAERIQQTLEAMSG